MAAILCNIIAPIGLDEPSGPLPVSLGVLDPAEPGGVWKALASKFGS